MACNNATDCIHADVCVDGWCTPPGVSHGASSGAVTSTSSAGVSRSGVPGSAGLSGSGFSGATASSPGGLSASSGAAASSAAVSACASSRLWCGGGCVDPLRDAAWCGAQNGCGPGNQGIACGQGASCAAGLCACAAGSYPSGSVPGTCTVCEAGFACPGGTTTRAACTGAGYAPAGAAACSVCPAGSATDTGGASGATACVPCAAGSYCPGDGTSVPCVAGTYQPNTGQSICLDSGAGWYVPAAGSTTRTACTSGGNYCPAAANTSVTACGGGKYTDTAGAAGAASCSTCTRNYYCTGNGTRRACPDAQGVPAGANQSTDCGCGVRLTVCLPDCSDFPAGCSPGSTQFMAGFTADQQECIPAADYGHGREALSNCLQ